ncbi:MAG: LysR family transcriptional regulator [Hoeflea sp.]|uniref:LysR family transcriptional regulator n=1 Tax=Hoeflea sp. TaxID=1940281 RepID=UPI001DFECB96|nr:LysR family transcriptional regulator [Hoeflea sp.]MBU4527193.1 LysR family transcriptional regulator [Alphaproteobacteria bacterium]MBU4547024.1 LysR family transcriptional regulator [Alphaproteobacteria bacterium]MBU4551464.1 LysR family transcriptional regulator [Alphaproteobacteria bacterium]MBV1725469.1 LysR family transcriptional regulator [Hoeflea sp.]MBV1759517.1 LysR family transcriptional regulator [Hoeflea sp.]
MDRFSLDWGHYRTFLAILKEGSQSGAARTLGLTQPTVGRHLDALEQAAGKPLFLRSHQGLAPTETALAMRAYAETMASSAAALARAASGDAASPEGTVRISASEVIGLEVLPPILADLQDRYPLLAIELSLSDAVEDLLTQQADIAVRMVEPTQGALLSRRIGGIPLGMFAHRRYLERHGTPETVEDLFSHRAIGFERQLAYVRDLLKDRPDIAGLHFSFRTDSNAAQLAMIRAGGGIGMCQVGLAARDPDLVRLFADRIELQLMTWLVMHEDLRTAPRCRVAFDALAEGLIAYRATIQSPAI